MCGFGHKTISKCKQFARKREHQPFSNLPTLKNCLLFVNSTNDTDMQQNKRKISIYPQRLYREYILQTIPPGGDASLHAIFKLLILEFTYNRITCLGLVNHLSFSKFAGFHFFYFSIESVHCSVAAGGKGTKLL